MTPSFKDKLAKTGPRKLLALDGGGIRGVITLEVLAKIEKQLQGQLEVAIANGQKTTLSQFGIWQPQRAKTFAVEFPVYIESILPVGIDVRVACWR
jgi:hypothetical protein